MHLLFLLALLYASSATTRVAESRAAFSLFDNNRGGATVSLIRDDGNDDDSMSILRPAGRRTRSKFVTRLFIDEKEDGGEKRVSRCEEKYIEQPLSHFAWGEGEENKSSFRTRYFVCSEYYRKDSPIFFYTGNEANVESYLENTGLMWENAEHFNALLVFAEHRYYGKSSPMTSGEKKDDDNDNDDADERNTLKH